MAKVLLISGNTTVEPYPVYPLGMSVVADALRRLQHEVREFDVQLGDSLEETINEFKPDMAGISMRNTDNFNYCNPSTYISSYKKIVSALRQASDMPLFIGGAAYSLFPEAILEKLELDYGITGEGESAVVELVETLAAGKKPPEKILRGADAQSMTDFNIIPRDKKMAAYYLDNGGMLNLQAKRGCPFLCAYCSYPLLEGACYRFRGAKEVVDEIEALRDEHAMDYYMFVDSVFNDKENRYLEIARELVRRKISIPFTALLRPQVFQKEDVEILGQAGLKAVEWGTDAASDETLKGMRKSFRWSEVVEANRMFVEAGIANCHFVIFGGPGETDNTVKEGLENIAALGKAVVIAALGVRIIPGTRIHEIAIEQNTVSRDDDLLEPKYYFSSNFDAAGAEKVIKKAFEGRRDRIFPPDESQDRIAILHKMKKRGALWDTLLQTRKGRRA